MTNREKLVQLIDEVAEGTIFVSVGEQHVSINSDGIAGHLLANGVTMQRMTSITEGFPSEECLAVNDCGAYMVGKIVKDPYSTVTGYACVSDFGGTEVGIGDVTH